MDVVCIIPNLHPPSVFRGEFLGQIMPCNIVHVESQIKNPMRYKLFKPYFLVRVHFVKLLCDSGIQAGKRKKELLVSNFWLLFPVGSVLLSVCEKAVILAIRTGRFKSE